jgi:type VI protein secretion system component VasK
MAGIALLFLTLLMGNCVYHLLFWFWASVLPNADVHTTKAHFYAWLTASAVVGLSWLYLIWRSYYMDGAPSPKAKK